MVRIIFLGTGDAFNSGGKLFSSVLIDGTLKILLDCSPTVVYSLSKLNYQVNSISHIIISHLHGDHVGGIPFIIMNLLHKGKGKISIIGPDNLKDFINKSFNLFFGDTQIDSVIEFRKLNDKVMFNMDYYKTDHTIDSYIYKLNIDGRIIIYTGDTSKPNISYFANNADILIHEASSYPSSFEVGHSSPYEAAEVAATSNVKRLALIHYPKFNKKIQRKVKSIFPNTYFTNDLQIIEI